MTTTSKPEMTVSDWRYGGFVVKAASNAAKVGILRTASTWEKRPDWVFVNHANVEGSHQGRGIGLGLYRRAIQEAKERGFTHFASAYPRSAAADRVWDKLREEYPVRSVSINGERHDAIPLNRVKAAKLTPEQAFTTLDLYDLAEYANSIPEEQVVKYRDLLLTRKDVDKETLGLIADIGTTRWPALEAAMRPDWFPGAGVDYFMQYTMKSRKQDWPELHPVILSYGTIGIIATYDREMGTHLLHELSPDDWMERTVSEWADALHIAILEGEENRSLTSFLTQHWKQALTLLKAAYQAEAQNFLHLVKLYQREFGSLKLES